jgi:ribosomal protein L21E
MMSDIKADISQNVLDRFYIGDNVRVTPLPSMAEAMASRRFHVPQSPI